MGIAELCGVALVVWLARRFQLYISIEFVSMYPIISVPFELWLLELLMSAQLQLVRPAATCHFSCQRSCNISAQLHPVSSDETCHLNCNVLAEL